MFSGAVNGATNGIRPANARPGAVTRLDQQITITKDGKRRIKPTLLDSGSSSPAPEAIGSYGALPAPASHRLGSSAASPRGAMVPPNVPAIAQRSMAYASMDFADSSLDGGYDTSMDMLGSTAGDMSFSGDRYGAGPSRQSPELDAASGTKRKATAMSDDAEPLRVGQRVKGRDVGRTLGGDAAREALGPQVQLRSQVPPTVHAIGACVPPGLPPPSLLSHFRREEAGGLVEVRNFDDGRECACDLRSASAQVLDLTLETLFFLSMQARVRLLCSRPQPTRRKKKECSGLILRHHLHCSRPPAPILSPSHSKTLLS